MTPGPGEKTTLSSPAPAEPTGGSFRKHLEFRHCALSHTVRRIPAGSAIAPGAGIALAAAPPRRHGGASRSGPEDGENQGPPAADPRPVEESDPDGTDVYGWSRDQGAEVKD